MRDRRGDQGTRLLQEEAKEEPHHRLRDDTPSQRTQPITAKHTQVGFNMPEAKEQCLNHERPTWGDYCGQATLQRTTKEKFLEKAILQRIANQPARQGLQWELAHRNQDNPHQQRQQQLFLIQPSFVFTIVLYICNLCARTQVCCCADHRRPARSMAYCDQRSNKMKSHKNNQTHSNKGT